MIAILFDNRRHLPFRLAVKMALREFQRAEHTQGIKPAAVVAHPDDAPAEAIIIDNLPIYTDRAMPRHHIRITGGIKENELAMVDEMVEAHVSGAPG